MSRRQESSQRPSLSSAASRGGTKHLTSRQRELLRRGQNVYSPNDSQVQALINQHTTLNSAALSDSENLTDEEVIALMIAMELAAQQNIRWMIEHTE